MRYGCHSSCFRLGVSCFPIIAACLSCTACVTTQEYPDDWSPIIFDSGECPDISGTYGNLGQLIGAVDEQSQSELLLSNFLFEDDVGPRQVVAISHPNKDAIQVNTVDGNGQEPRVLSRKDGDYVCEDKKIWLLQSQSFMEEGAVPLFEPLPSLGRMKIRVGLAPAEDGSLIGDVRYSGFVMLAMVVPIAGGSQEYIRWPAEADTHLCNDCELGEPSNTQVVD